MISEIRKKIVSYYFDPGGLCPFQRWLKSLTSVEVRLVRTRLMRVEDGNYGDYKSLGGGILELRFHQGYRIYFSEVGNTIVILLCGGDKSSQEKDIAKAKEYKKRLDEES